MKYQINSDQQLQMGFEIRAVTKKKLKAALKFHDCLCGYGLTNEQTHQLWDDWDCSAKDLATKAVEMICERLAKLEEEGDARE